MGQAFLLIVFDCAAFPGEKSQKFLRIYLGFDLGDGENVVGKRVAVQQNIAVLQYADTFNNIVAFFCTAGRAGFDHLILVKFNGGNRFIRQLAHLLHLLDCIAARTLLKSARGATGGGTARGG